MARGLTGESSQPRSTTGASLTVGGVRQDWSLELTRRSLLKFGADVRQGSATYDYSSRDLEEIVSPDSALIDTWDTTTVVASPSGTRIGRLHRAAFSADQFSHDGSWGCGTTARRTPETTCSRHV